MAFQLSPGVNITEIDLTTIVPAVATSDGAISGLFRWGPVGERILVDSENILVNRFGKPSNYNAETWFTASNFLSYTNRLWISRAANTSGETPYAMEITYDIEQQAFTGIEDTSDFGDEHFSLVDGYYITQSNSSYMPIGKEYSITVGENYFTIEKSFLGKHATVTGITNGADAVITINNSDFADLQNNDPVVFSTTGNLPAGIVAGTVYYVKNVNVDLSGYPSFKISETSGGAALDTSSDGNGVHTIRTNFKADVYFGNPSTTYSAVALATTDSVVANLVNQIVKNQNDYIHVAPNFDTDVLYVAKYPGSLGNSLKVAVCDSANAYASNVSISGTDNNLPLEFFIGANFATASFAGMANTEANTLVDSFTKGDNVLAGNSSIGMQYLQFVSAKIEDIEAIEEDLEAEPPVEAVPASTLVTLYFQDRYRLHTNFAANTVTKHWEYFNSFGSAPNQSDYQASHGNTSAKDELHVIVVDEHGQFTGSPGTILEVYKGLSRATDAKNNDNTGNYYRDVINQNSKYVWVANDRTEAVSNTAINLTSSTEMTSGSFSFTLGSDGFNDESDSSAYSVIAAGYDLFASSEDIDISLVLQGRPLGGTTSVNGTTVSNYQLANYLIDNISDHRRDCVAFVSPDKSLVLNSFGTEATNLVAWRGALASSSYTFMDSGYKYQYDRYNDVYRWIPLNGDIAGLCARTDNTNDAWWSPAGFNRGQIKNIVKLAYNPRKSERDVLYVSGVNPVVAFPGQGTVLYGDKTLQAKPSAFDRINVRRLFIVLEKAIAVAAKYSLFEFNDSFTQAQFRNLVNPYLRSIKGKRGITDFLVVCDATNNTPQVIDSNQFVGDIYIKPARSINFIQLNFVAVATGVQFSEVVGKF
jgi:hypothetical protein